MADYQAAHAMEWDGCAGGVVSMLIRFTSQAFGFYCAQLVPERLGTIVAIDRAERVVIVDLDPEANGAPRRVAADFGQRSYPTTLVGRRVRVWQVEERRIEPRGDCTATLTSTTWTVDTVLGR